MLRKKLRYVLTTLAATLLLSLTVSLATTTPAAAYGNTAVYQVGFSLNCTNPAAPCAGVFGLGGLWGWIEADQGGTGDASVAGCGHVSGGIGSGARGGTFQITWALTSFAAPIPFALDPSGTYLTTFGLPDGTFSVPATPGHYDVTVLGTHGQIQVVKL